MTRNSNTDAAMILSHMGPFIRQRRTHLRLTLREVAARCGSTKSHIWAFENGRSGNPTIAMALRLCRALQCSLNSLLGIDAAQPSFTDDEMALIAAYRKIFKQGQST